LITAHEDSNSFVQDILRDYILELFQYGDMWDEPNGKFYESLNSSHNEFLEQIFNEGYITLNNKLNG